MLRLMLGSLNLIVKKCIALNLAKIVLCFLKAVRELYYVCNL